MIDSFELYNDFRTWVNTQQGGFFSPQSIFIRVANVASIKLWNKWTKIAEKSQEIKDNLSPFLVSKNIIAKESTSVYRIVELPEFYGRFATAKILINGTQTVPSKDVEEGKCCNGEWKSDSELAEDYYKNTKEAAIQMVDNQRWSACLEHLTKYPTFEKPKMTQINNQYKVAPREVSVVIVDYYRRPKDATFVYTLATPNLNTGAGGQIIYNKTASIPFEWSQTVKNEFLDIIKDVFIGYTRDGVFQQISSAQKATP